MMKSPLAIFFDINAKQKPSMKDHAREGSTQETEIRRLKFETNLGKLVRPCLKKEHKIKLKGKFISVKFIR